MTARLGLEIGYVTNRDDPEGRGRVKLCVPGLIEPETPGWAQPLAGTRGKAQHGRFDPPPVDSTVGVLFHQGEIDEVYYLSGPPGAPGGTSDVPTNSAIDGNDRQNAVMEDQEWRIERDSRSGTGQKRYLVRHKNSSLAVFIDADNDKVFLVRETATQGLMLGTAYRTAESGFLTSLLSALQTFASACTGSVDPTLSTAATALNAAIVALQSDPMATDATAHVSTKAFTE